MLLLSLSLFVVAALIGLTIAVALFKGRKTSKPVAFTHGAVAATALVLLILHRLQNPSPLLTTAIALFVVGALGGSLLLANDLRGNPGPKVLVVIHALAGLTAATLVALVAFA